ncbi:MAG: ribose-phosphate diphosphokinase [Bacteroidia bacterium]
MIQPPLLFATTPYKYLLQRICALNTYELGEVEVKIFPDGERYQRILSPISQRDIVLIGGTHTEAATMELYDLSCAFAKYGARSLNIIIPYFGYSTMERAIKSGEIVTAKNRARLLSSIPPAGTANRIVLMDLHAEGMNYYFEGAVVPLHLYAKETILEGIRSMAKGHFILGSTDAGRAKWVESLANDLGVEGAFVFKRRIDGRTTELTAMSARVQDAQVIIYDDMIRTGGSLINAAKAYLGAGATEVSAIATHGILPEDSLKRIQDSGIFKKVIVTDTHPHAVELENGFLEVRSVAGILDKWIQAQFS